MPEADVWRSLSGTKKTPQFTKSYANAGSPSRSTWFGLSSGTKRAPGMLAAIRLPNFKRDSGILSRVNNKSGNLDLGEK